MNRAPTVAVIGRAFLGVLLLGHSSLFAQPTLIGTSGAIRTPDAHVLNPTEFGLAFFRVEEKPPAGVKQKFAVFSAQAGLREDLEIGASVWETDQQESDWFLGAKLRIVRETMKAPAVSVGALVSPEGVNDKEELSVFAVASQKLRFPEKLADRFSLSGHVGIGSKVLDGAFYGLEATMSKEVKVKAEYDTRNINVSAQLFLSPGIVVQGMVLKDQVALGLLVLVTR